MCYFSPRKTLPHFVPSDTEASRQPRVTLPFSTRPRPWTEGPEGQAATPRRDLLGRGWAEGQRARGRGRAVAQASSRMRQGRGQLGQHGHENNPRRHRHLPACTARFTPVQHPTVCTARSPRPEPPQADSRASGISQDRARLSPLQPWYEGTGPRDCCEHAGEPDGTGERMFAMGPPPLSTRRGPRSPSACAGLGLYRDSRWVFPAVP